MWDGEQSHAGLLLGLFHPVPELLGVFRVVGRDRQYLVRRVLAAAEDDVAVQVVAVGTRGPFEADERREQAGDVVALGRLGRLGPHALAEVGFGERIVASLRGEFPEFIAFEFALDGARFHDLCDLASELACKQLFVAVGDGCRQPEIFRMIGNHEKVERPCQPRGYSRGRNHFLAAGETKRIIRRHRRTDETGVGRERGVQMRVAEEHLVRKILFGIRRVNGIRWRHNARCILCGCRARERNQGNAAT